MDYANTFEPDTIVENFRWLYKKYPSTTVKRSDPVYELSEKHRKIHREILPQSVSTANLSMSIRCTMS
jgi:hypothetical protein